MNKSAANPGYGAVQDRAKSYLPLTFEERGSSVPFTSPILTHARVRYNEKRVLEALVPGLSGGRGTYVLPWSMLSQVIPLSVHDRMLHETLDKKKYITPVDVREVVLEVAKTGVGGVEMAQAARQSLDAERQLQELSRFTLVAEAIHQVGSGGHKLTLQELATPKGQLAARDALDSFAQSVGLTHDQIIDSLEQWSLRKAPVGLDKPNCAGRLRVLVTNLDKWQRTIKEWGQAELTDMQFMAMKCADALEATLKLARARMKQLDDQDGDLRAVLAGWSKAEETMRHWITRLCWLLDGWDVLLEKWLEASKGHRYEQRQALEEIVSFLPLVPQDELTAEQKEMWEGLGQNQSSWVKELQGWQSGAMDQELIDRLERYRERGL